MLRICCRLLLCGPILANIDTFHVKRLKTPRFANKTIKKDRYLSMERREFFEEYNRIFSENGLQAYTSDETVDKMYDMVSHMLEVNAAMNLTAITDWNEIILKHLADSCTVLPYIPQGARVCDVGCGGGFPSLPVAIARPDVRVVGIDSTGKKVNYINESAALLGLNNLSAICGRAEDLANTELRESFDVATARAVAALPVLCELCIPFVRVGGTFCAMKGTPNQVEMETAVSAYRTLGAPLDPSGIHHLTLSAESRTVLVARKLQKTPPKYPRPYAKIKKSPL